MNTEVIYPSAYSILLPNQLLSTARPYYVVQIAFFEEIQAFSPASFIVCEISSHFRFPYALSFRGSSVFTLLLRFRGLLVLV